MNAISSTTVSLLVRALPAAYRASNGAGGAAMNGLLVRAAHVVATGVAGAAVYDGVKRIARSDAVRNATVTVTAWGLRGIRKAETGAEKVRLATADVVSEARARVGEEAPAPAASNGHGHQH
jgi:hypothetical protein